MEIRKFFYKIPEDVRYILLGGASNLIFIGWIYVITQDWGRALLFALGIQALVFVAWLIYVIARVAARKGW